jgi:hypothetical protein
MELLKSRNQNRLHVLGRNRMKQAVPKHVGRPFCQKTQGRVKTFFLTICKFFLKDVKLWSTGARDPASRATARQGGSRSKLCKVERVVLNALGTSPKAFGADIPAPSAARLPRLRNETLPKVNRAFSSGGFLLHESWGAAPGSPRLIRPTADLQ